MALPRFFFLPATYQYESSSWRPAVDVYRHRGGWLIKCDLAGVRPEDIRISIEGRRLTLGGTRRDFAVSEQAEVYSMEITYDRFERVIELPCNLEEAELRTEYDNGMLLVRLITERVNP